MVRAYAKVTGIALILIAVADALFDIQGVSLLEDVLYLSTGAIFAYIGFRLRDPRDIRYVVSGMGVLYLLAGMSVLALNLFFGLPLESEDEGFVGDILRAAFGVLNILVAALLPDEGDPR